MPPDPQSVAKWLALAREDLRMARHALTADPPGLFAATFHAQQCAEKALKRYLASRGEQPPRVHSLDLLFDLCSAFDALIAPLADRCAWLSDFAVGIRYPDFEPAPDLTTAQAAVEDAATLLGYIEDRLGKDHST